MIVTHIIGGLGNQLFQFAAGKALATRLGTGLLLDTQAYNRPRDHGLGLGHFNIQTGIADPVTLPSVRQGKMWKIATALLQKSPFQPVIERGQAFDPKMILSPDNSFLKGYWQSEKYFADHADQIRHSLQIITEPSSENTAVMARQDARCAVSLHIRRGDYVSNAKFNATHGTCDLQYYQRAATAIAASCTEDPVFFVFSDDPDWVQENLHLPFETELVRHNNAATNYEDLRLMSRCQHHIIANSSFSWWGAWLNPSANKRVIAPKRWFANPKMTSDDILPDTWEKL